MSSEQVPGVDVHAPTAAPHVPRDRPRARHPAPLPFWLLQAAELAVTAALVDFSLHVARGQLLVAGAVIWALLAVTARGPLGIVRVCSRRLHRALVVVVGLALALAPIAPVARPDLQGILITVLVGVGMARLATLTRIDEPVTGPAAAGATLPQVADTVGVVTAPRTVATPSAGATRPAAEATEAHVAGTAVHVTARRAGLMAARLRTTPRRAGRMAGRLRSAPRDTGRIVGKVRSARR